MTKMWMTGLGLLALATPAHALELGMKVEGAAALAITAPQSDLFQVGGSAAIKALVGLGRSLDLVLGGAGLALPGRTSRDADGGALIMGGGLRLKRPYDRGSRPWIQSLSPWVEVEALYVRTGMLNRLGGDASIGLSMPIGAARNVWIGPFVRYMHIGQPVKDGFDNRDAKILMAGLSLELSPGASTREPSQCRQGPLSCPPAPEPELDRDGDGLPDRYDRCPDAAGPLANAGCPVYEKVVIKENRLELKEKIYFAWDQAVLEPASFAVLDDVARALKDNKGFHVQVDGHADSTGPEEHNQDLSERRAEAVMDYLVSRGVSKDRLTFKGFSSSVPTDTNATVEGRENNRRVEFAIEIAIVSPKGVAQ